MNRILIENGRVIDPASAIDRVGSVFIADGKIAALFERPDGFEPDRIIDAAGQIVCPGFIDISTRLREPGQSNKATFNSETRAAAAGGITTLVLQPDTKPVIDTPAMTELVKELAEKTGYRQILPIGALTQNLDGQELSSMLALKQAGCIAVGNGGKPISNLLVMRRAMEYAASHGLLFIYRPNEHSLSNKGCAHEGAFATRYGLPGIPETAETIALAQCLELAELTGCRVHFGQISCRRSVIKIQQAQKYGLNVSADIAAHQLHLTENDMKPFDSAYHVLPPLRSEQDKNYLRHALAQGVITTLCSDHQPHDLDAKLGAFPETESGISSLETLLPLMLKLVDERVVTLAQGIAALTCRPADILRLDCGRLMPGKPADICIFDPECRWRVDRETWHSKGVNTPYWQQTLQGRVSVTLQAGTVIFEGDSGA